MNSAQHLRLEDRPEFERVLDEALRIARRRPGPAGDHDGPRLDADRLRAMALGATPAIAVCAAAEYERFVRLREELRRPERAPSPQGPPPGRGTAAPSGSSGAGLGAMLSVLAPLLAGTAAVIFLLIGYALRVVDPEPSVAAPMRDAGRIFAALAAAALLAAGAGLLVTALRNGSGSARAKEPGPDALAEEVALARTAWRTALMERGVLPFLQEALAAGGGDGPPPPAPRSRHPRLGYSQPGFTSPAPGPADPERTGD